MVDFWLPVSINSQTIAPEVLKKLFEDGEMRYELCRGELKALPASKIFHSLLLAWISHLLIEKTNSLADWWVIADPHSKIRDDHWRRPGVAVIRASDAEPWKYVMPGHWPALCIEIVSTPDQTVDDMLDKSKIYHEQGVNHCWVLDPESQAAWTYDKGKEPVWIPNKDGFLEAPTIGIRLSLDDVWSGLQGKRSKEGDVVVAALNGRLDEQRTLQWREQWLLSPALPAALEKCLRASLPPNMTCF